MSETLINDIFRTAHSEGRSSLFEHEVYRLLAVAGIASTPRHEVIAGGVEPADELLASFRGSRVVVKIVSGSIAHKSDVGGVAIVPNQPTALRAACTSMLAELAGQDIAGLMLTEFIEADVAGGASELLVGIRNTREFGMILSAGIGGVDTELYAAGCRRGQGGRVLSAQGLGNVCEVARVKGHSHRAARGFMQACGCRVPLCYQQHGGRGCIAAHSLDDVPQPRLAATLQKQLVGALSGFLRGDALNIPQRACCIAQGHQ